MRRLFPCAVLAALLLAPSFVPLAPSFVTRSRAEPVADLYRAEILVTGERQETRDPALSQGYRDVMVKVSGDPRLLADARLDAAFDPSAVHTYSYRDLMAGIPKHDEQGTRDRPFELTVDYVPEKIEAALAELGRTAWTTDRPRVLVLIGIEFGPTRFVLTDEGEPGSIQRRALMTSSRRTGVPVALPTRAMVEASGLSAEALKNAGPEAFAEVMTAAGADRVFSGHMRFSDEALGWVAHWRLADGGHTYRWGIEGVNFDEAFRHAMRGMAQALSGHGAP